MEIAPDSAEGLGGEEGLGGCLEAKAGPVSRALGREWLGSDKDLCRLHYQEPMSFLKVVPGRHNTDELSGWGQERDIYREEKQGQHIPRCQQE